MLLTEKEKPSKADVVAFAKTKGPPKIAFPSVYIGGKVPVLGAGLLGERDAHAARYKKVIGRRVRTGTSLPWPISK
ncbi:hypothetical protein CPY51_24055 [Rhizobium tubonense]|uniref:Uncharacterized protein n=1 Tax=Rhizobium tubonense TaxID=484088 RepID=A0A2W4CB55_9HYPH|nr:hypothetical protein CPY51_24055 [Rhizobium tubonense]